MDIKARIKTLEEDLYKLLQSDLELDLKEVRANDLIHTININRRIIGMPKINKMSTDYDTEED